MKKVSLALATAGLTASLGAFAALPTDAAPFQVVVPNIKSGLDITLEGLYLQPTNSDLDYATTAYTTATVGNNTFVVTNNSQVQSVDPDYNFGFRVGLGYTFEDSGNDVQLAWTHFNHTDSDSVTAGLDQVLTSRFGVPFQPLNIAIGDVFSFVSDASASSDVKTRLDAVDLDVGQFIDVGTRLRMRLFAGLRAARVSSDMSNTYNYSATAIGSFPDLSEITADVSERITAVNETVLTENYNSKFTGIGPRVGVDSVYHIGNCFGVVAHAAVALLVGETESDSNGTLSQVTTFTGGHEYIHGYGYGSEQIASTFNGDLGSDDSSRVVPAIDAKLGLNYSHVFGNESVLTIEGGYQVTQYIDAVDRLDASVDGVSLGEFNTLSDQHGPIVLPYSVSTTRTTSSVGFNGPYLSLNWKV